MRREKMQETSWRWIGLSQLFSKGKRVKCWNLSTLKWSLGGAIHE